MGSIVEAHCSCGYSSGPLLEGCGRAGPQTCCVLARCDRCQEVVSVKDGTTLCRKCGSPLALLELGWRRLCALHQCPRCRKAALSLTAAGIWD